MFARKGELDERRRKEGKNKPVVSLEKKVGTHVESRGRKGNARWD